MECSGPGTSPGMVQALSMPWNVPGLENAMEWAQTTDRTTVISINSDAYSWTPGGADWYVGVPEINDRQSIREAREVQEAFRKKQRQGI